MKSGLAIKICAFCLVAISVYVVWAAFIEGTFVRKPIVYWEGSFVMQQETYRPGESLKIRMVATKFYPITGQVTWSMTNLKTHEVIPFATRQTTMPSGFNDVYIELGRVPDKVTPGMWKMMGTVVYPVNSIRDITYHLQSIPFEIISNGNK